MKTIWKFPLSTSNRQTISVPCISHFLSVGIDPLGNNCLWFAVDPDSGAYEMEIIIVGTGLDLPHVGDFLGTTVQDGFVAHFFTGPRDSVGNKGFHYQTRDN